MSRPKIQRSILAKARKESLYSEEKRIVRFGDPKQFGAEYFAYEDGELIEYSRFVREDFPKPPEVLVVK